MLISREQRDDWLPPGHQARVFKATGTNKQWSSGQTNNKEHLIFVWSVGFCAELQIMRACVWVNRQYVNIQIWKMCLNDIFWRKWMIKKHNDTENHVIKTLLKLYLLNIDSICCHLKWDSNTCPHSFRIHLLKFTRSSYFRVSSVVFSGR